MSDANSLGLLTQLESYFSSGPYHIPQELETAMRGVYAY